MSRRKRYDKLTRAAHIKSHTVGTSNELSFSVLDAAKNQLGDDSDDKGKGFSSFGRIVLFTLPFGRKKPVATPSKEGGLPLSNGDFASADDLTSPWSVGPADGGYPLSSSSLGGSGGSGGSGVTPSAHFGSMADYGGADGQKKPRSRAGQGSVASFAGSLHTAEEEIAHRKRRRRRQRRLAAAFVAVVTTALLAAGGTYLYHDNQRHSSQVVQLDGVLSSIANMDDAFVSLDEAVNDPFGSSADEQYSELSSSVPSLTQDLDDAAARLQSAAADMRESPDKEATNQAFAAIAARQTLADTGMQMLDQAVDARAAASQLGGAWQQVLDADSLARDAAKLVTDTTDANIQASKEKTNQALAVFSKARDAIKRVQTQYPPVDLGSLASYVDKRIESLGYAVASDDALLARNKDAAAAQNDAYNTADAKAASLAKNIPADPTDLVHDAYRQAVTDLSQAYSTARLQAGSADAFIRDYLGAGFR